MGFFYRQIKSELYKHSHCLLLPLHIILPLGVAAVFLSYYRFSSLRILEKDLLSTQFIAVAFPLVIGIITALGAEQESDAGHFQAILQTPGLKWTAHVAKLLSLLIFGFCGLTLSFVVYGAVMMLLNPGGMALGDTFIWTLVVFMAHGPLYGLHYWVAVVLGKGAAITLGLFGSVMSGLLLTGLGDVIWPFLPWGLAGHQGSCYVMSRFSSHSYFYYDRIVLSQWTLGFMLLIIAALLIVWGKKFEGRYDGDL